MEVMAQAVLVEVALANQQEQSTPVVVVEVVPPVPVVLPVVQELSYCALRQLRRQPQAAQQ
jgi:hypothetical protein